MADEIEIKPFGMNPSTSFREAVENSKAKAKPLFDEMRRAKNEQDYSLSAIRGGSTAVFENEEAAKKHYGGIWKRKQEDVKKIRDELIGEMDKILANHLALDIDAINETNAILSVCTNDDQIRHYLANPAHRTYGHYAAIAAYGRQNKNMPTAKAVAVRLQAFEEACAAVPVKAKGVSVKSGDGNFWSSWIDGSIDDVEAAYNALGEAADGKRADAWDQIGAGVA